MDNTESKLNSPLNTPLAIIAAGLIVAGAIVLTRVPLDQQKNRITDTTKDGQINLDKPIHKLLGLNSAEFKKCLGSEEAAERVEAQYQDGLAAGVQGTPGSVIVTNDGAAYSLPGAQPIENVRKTIDKILGGRAGPSDSITVGPVSPNDHILGNPEADIKIIEFSDLECPFCKRFHPVLRQIVEEYEGGVAWIYRHFPIDSLHSQADAEAAAAECAAQQGGNEMFWKYIDKLFEVTPSNNGFDLEYL